jgi:hypothetical protein
VNGAQIKSGNFPAAAGSLIPAVGASSPAPGIIARYGSALIGAGNFGVTGFTNPIPVYSTSAGDIDNLRLYTRALSAAEIQLLMQADSGTAVTNCTTVGAVTTNLDLCTTTKGQLTIFNSSPGHVLLTWPTQNNAFYLLQSSDELSPFTWIQLWAGAGAGTNVTVSDPTASRQKRFYRLLSNQ